MTISTRNTHSDLDQLKLLATRPGSASKEVTRIAARLFRAPDFVPPTSDDDLASRFFGVPNLKATLSNKKGNITRWVKELADAPIQKKAEIEAKIAEAKAFLSAWEGRLEAFRKAY